MVENILKERLTNIFEWHRGMASEKTGRLVYIYDPEGKTVVAGSSPIRDTTSVWDMEILSDFLNRQELEPVIKRSVDHYSHYLIRRDGYVILNPNLLKEPSSIAHSAFMLSSLIHSHLSDRKEKALPLADGIFVQHEL